MLNQQVAQQAAMLSFERLFLLFGIALLCALPLLLAMRRTRFLRRSSPPADH